MKLSDRLYDRVRTLWKEAAEKPFVTEMAEGTLAEGLFRRYMLQDYLYLLAYIDILGSTLQLSANPRLSGFLRDTIEATRNETERVHLPNMEKIGISGEEISSCQPAGIVVEYLDFMRSLLREEGLLAGLTALLQCSWIYAYIGQILIGKYHEEIQASPYRSWFVAYTCPEYLESNRKWIDVLDEETAGIEKEEADRLCSIFERCAGYENRFWDMLYQAE